MPGFGPRLMFAAGYVGRLLAVGLVLGSALFVGGLTQISLNDYLRPPRGDVTTRSFIFLILEQLLCVDAALISVYSHPRSPKAVRSTPGGAYHCPAR